MNKPISALILLAVAALVTTLFWDKIAPTLFDKPENLEAIESSGRILDQIMPLRDDDRFISEVVYNHGGQLGVGRRYSSLDSIAETQHKFAALQAPSKPAIGSSFANKSERVTHCYGDVQVGLDALPEGRGYFVFAVKDATAVRPVGCQK